MTFVDKIVLHNFTNPKNVFLLDGIGAFLSALFLFFILSFFEQQFGLPLKILYLLFCIAFIFSLYSIACFLLIKSKWRVFLKIILIANLVYCLLTAIILFMYRNSSTTLGFVYFSLEILVICFILFIEYKTLMTLENN